jgi:hypothetical protein
MSAARFNATSFPNRCPLYLRKYGVQTTINFQLFEVDGVDFRVDAAHAAGDTKIMKDEGAEANTTNGFTDEGQGYSIVLTATEMQAARIVVYIVDSATKAWLDTAFVVETYGNASAMHAVDLDDSVRAGLTALPNAAADAAGGLPISDAGGLDLDAMKASVDVIQAFWNVFILTAGTIGATGNDTTHLHLAGQTYGNDELNDYCVVVYDNSESEYHGVWISGWVLATELATLSPGLPFTPEASVDTYWIFALKQHPDTETIRTATAAIKAVTDLIPDAGAMSDLATILTAVNLLQRDPQKNIAMADLQFYMVDSTDHVTPETGLTITAQISKDSGAFAGCANAAAEIGNGWYVIDLTATEMNADSIILRFSATGADDCGIAMRTVS